MTRNEFLKDVLEACSFFSWEINGVWKHFDIVLISTNIIKISVVSWGFDEGYTEVVEFQNDETLIDSMLDKL